MSDQTSSNHTGVLIQTWMKQATEVWEQSVKQMAGYNEPAAATAGAPPKLKAVPKSSDRSGGSDAAQGPEKTWQELAGQMARDAFSGYFAMQKEFFAKSGNMQTFFDQKFFDSTPNKMYSDTLEGFEKEFKKYLQMPALGITRSYQEKINQALTKYEDFKKSLTRFMNYLSRPFETSWADLQKMTAELSQTDKDPKALYRLWIKRLEAEYMSLYKTPHYIEAMTGALSAYEDFAAARKAVFEDLLRPFPVPTHTEMDELYKEIYQLKKRLKELEKHFNLQRQAS
jgi:polyhydroxyalkanoate synthase subunit PhaE